MRQLPLATNRLKQWLWPKRISLEHPQVACRYSCPPCKYGQLTEVQGPCRGGSTYCGFSVNSIRRDAKTLVIAPIGDLYSIQCSVPAEPAMKWIRFVLFLLASGSLAA